MRRVQTNAELAALHSAGAGLVFNDFTSGPAGARDNVLHAASCRSVRKMLDGADPVSCPSVRKMFFDTGDEAHAWLAAERGLEGLAWKYCSGCMPGHAASRTRAPAPSPMPPATTERSARWHDRAVPAPGLWPAHAAFTRPESPPIALPVPPRLASWNRAGHPDQVRLARYLAVADDLLRPYYGELTGPLALRLDVGLPADADLLDQRDLDNYLYPLARHLSSATGGTIACAWATKQHAGSSQVRIEPAVPALGPPPAHCFYTVHTTASGQSRAFKEQIRDQLSAAAPLPPGPLQLQLHFTIGASRNWLNLWQPVIDALGPILGQAPGAGPWSPLDGRIIDLGMHRHVDPGLGNDILIAIAARHVPP